MAIDPEVQKKLDDIMKRIDTLAASSKQGEFVLPFGMLGLSPGQADEFKKEVEIAARKKLQEFGVSLPQVAGTYSYSR